MLSKFLALKGLRGGGATGGGGGAEVKTCNITFKQDRWTMRNPAILFLAYSALVNGKIENVVLGEYSWGNSEPIAMLTDTHPLVLENVVCGTQMSFILSDFGNGNEVTFDESVIQNLNDDYSYGFWTISSNATDFDISVGAFM